MMVMKIKDFISEHEAQFFRDYAHYGMSNPSRQIQLATYTKQEVQRRTQEHNVDDIEEKKRVDRLYYSINSPFHLFHRVRQIAEKNWKVPITFRADSYAHIMHYKKDSEGLKWHTDGNMGWVSASINITPDYAYEGGNFQIESDSKFTCKYREIVLYDRMVRHRVTPLTGGEKMSLVLWLPKVNQEELNKGFQWKYE